MNATIKNFLISQSFLFGSIILCTLLAPEVLTMNQGISYFSSKGLTLLPFSIGLLGTAWFVYKAGKAHDIQSSVTVGAWTKAIAILLVLIVLFPFAINETIRSFHRLFSAGLLLLQLVFAARIALKVRRTKVSAGLVAALAISLLATGFYFGPIARTLLVGEIIFELIFASIILYAYYKDE